jgi:transaldolase / glucose-6-phosphate isomerase
MITAQATTNPFQSLQSYRQSVWLDYIRRSLITSGELQQLIDQDGLRGVTSNPAIFEKAIENQIDLTGTLFIVSSKSGSKTGFRRHLN